MRLGAAGRGGRALRGERGEGLEALGAGVGEAEADDPVVVGSRLAGDQPGGIGAVDQFDGAVVAQEQVVGDLADGRSAGVVMAADGEQQLMLAGVSPAAWACCSLQR